MKLNKYHLAVTLNRIIIALFGWSICSNAASFTVGTLFYDAPAVGLIQLLGNSNHENISNVALMSYRVTLGGNQLSFSNIARDVISASNASTDSEYLDVPEIHFDDESFRAGNVHLWEVRRAIKQKLMAGQYLNAQRLLGFALHSVADFYAHTTWIEKKFPGTAELGVPDSEFVFRKSTKPTCTNLASQLIDGKSTGIILDDQLTGEYYASEQVTGNIFWRNSDSKCIHGSNRHANSASGGAGINKDDNVRDFFFDAYSRAIEASTKYVNLIVADLNGNETAIRGLLGHHGKKPGILSGWCGQTLSFTNNLLPPGWQSTAIRSGPGIQSERLFASPVNSGAMLDAAAISMPADVKSIVVSWDSFRSDSYSGQFNSIEFRTAAGTRWRFSDVNATHPVIGSGVRRFDSGLYSGPFYGGGLLSDYLSVLKPLGVGTFKTRLTLTDMGAIWAVTDTAGVTTHAELPASPGFRIADLVGAGVVAYTTTDGPTWMDNISFACNR